MKIFASAWNMKISSFHRFFKPGTAGSISAFMHSNCRFSIDTMHYSTKINQANLAIT